MLSVNAQRQVQNTEMLWAAQRERQRERDLKSVSEWKEDLCGTMASRIERNHRATRKEEMELLHKELVMVRRAALHKLLQEEQQQYKDELNLQGKTFYTQRI
ncbi:uncharacterized protein C1orf189 [Xenopus laevis]|uniref:Uncharacterized protein C1orf189 n=2 Tax=Xenopus laevis TaxID=8355 RepID=A0A1L8FD38_XENLA|nr:uncharacterized protein C1orf189 [Xenopus laevis]XP_018087041.1 uncharacterized protein C1orf189 [Xenopus laevis]XP_018087042.1 uncharacterized protein C1orf189 [Xenopus laevis]OCT69512.1 hypothetical protein XELAEV_18040823mg [Xenopus laevis]